MADTEDGFPHFPELPDLEARRHQIFFTLTESEIARLERFAEPRTYQDGETMFEEGKVALADSMSRYLIDRIAATPNIHLHPHTELIGLERADDGEMCMARWRNRQTGSEQGGRVGHVFVFVGADPATEWLRVCPVALDDRGFVKTGPSLTLEELVRTGRRTVPASLETSVAGVFAVGDVRSGSVKRVGGAIGEGAAVVAQVHAYLSERVRRAVAPG